VADTHGIAQWRHNRFITDSSGLGWHDAYTSLAVEAPWSATLPALPNYAVAYCVRGSAHIRRTVDGERRQLAHLRPRNFGIIPPDRRSDWDLDGAPEIQLVYIRRETIDDLVRTEFDIDPADVTIEPKLAFNDALLEQLVGGLLDEARRDRDRADSGLWADALSRVIALALLRHHSSLSLPAARPKPTSCRVIDDAVEYVHEHLGSDLSLTTIAAAVGSAPQQLARRFRQATGTPLHEFVIGQRVERAQRLLATTDGSIADIAITCGFSSQSHLTTVFRRRVGATPAAYRRT